MRQYEVTWKTFHKSKPAVGMKIVVETDVLQHRDRVTGKWILRPTHGYLTGTFVKQYNQVPRRVCIERRHGGLSWLHNSCRWYPAGSERLKKKVTP